MNGARALGAVGFGALAYVGTATGALSVDVNVGRPRRALDPLRQEIAVAPEVVFDVIGEPYLAKTPHAMEAKLRVFERGTDLVLAEHFTPIGLGLRATTVETVPVRTPEKVSFRLVRGPVPNVTETFELAPTEAGTAFTTRESSTLTSGLLVGGRRRPALGERRRIVACRRRSRDRAPRRSSLKATKTTQRRPTGGVRGHPRGLARRDACGHPRYAEGLEESSRSVSCTS